MTSSEHKLDAHAKPPDELKAFYKKYQKLKADDLDRDDVLLDFANIERCHGLNLSQEVDYRQNLSSDNHSPESESLMQSLQNDLRDRVQVYEHDSMPGLKIIPNLLPESSQKDILDVLLHRDVSNPVHLSNLHLHYNVKYPPQNASFFSLSPNSTEIIQQPKDATVHKAVNVQQMLNKKLRWITLGGQYDWTNKVYPSSQPPQFPPDISRFLHFLFPEMIPQAAIVNFYSPGDTLSLHRDVAEECHRGLISLSIGCDAVFVLGLDGKMVSMRLRSGDAVYMDGPSRYAWHGVPQIVPNTCPEWLRSWPGDQYEHWQGWMANKRINLNVRQMWDVV